VADKKISQLTSATTPLAGTEVLPIVQGGSTVKVSVDNLTAGKAVAASQLTIENNSSSNAVRITQTGSGNALVVEDSANPDATPFVIDSNGNVLAGTTTANGILSVVGNQMSVGSAGGSDSLGIQIKGTTLSAIPAAQVQSYVATGNSSMGVAGDLLVAPRTDVACSIRFITGTTPAERMKIASNGDISAVTGNLVVGTAGKGIDFSANGGDVLSQYDEGTYTPVFTASSSNPTVTYGLQRGKYVRVGNVVTVSAFISWSAISGGSGDLRISLPFAGESSVGASGAGSISSLDGITFAALRTFCSFQPQANVLYGNLPQTGSGVSSSNTTIAQMASSGSIIFSCTYLI